MVIVFLLETCCHRRSSSSEPDKRVVSRRLSGMEERAGQVLRRGRHFAPDSFKFWDDIFLAGPESVWDEIFCASADTILRPSHESAEHEVST